MDHQKPKPPVNDLNEEDKKTYEYLMSEGKIKHPTTSNYILDLAIRYYIIYGDDMNNVKSLSEENLKKMRDKYVSDQSEFYNSIEIIRDADISDEKRKQYETDKAVIEEELKNEVYSDELKEKMRKVCILEGIPI